MKTVLSTTTLVLLLALVVLPAWADLTPGHVDSGFDPGSGANGDVLALAIQADGSVLTAGNFTTMDGIARNRIARLRADGSLDSSFDPGSGADNRVYAVAVQPDGKLIIGGSFATVGGVVRNCIARLAAGGSLDTTFDPGAGADSVVRAVAVQAGGKIVISGDFSTVDGIARPRVARLNADGSLDTTFDPGTGPSGGVYAVAIQPDGKVLIGGSFSTVDGVSRNRIARLNANGSLDASFDPGAGANNLVSALALQDDGKAVIGGLFTMVDGVGRTRIARLDAGGTLDTTFDPGDGADAIVNAVALQANGKVLAGGAFATMNGVPHDRIARLDVDGSLDTTFDPGTGADDNVWAIAVQVDGKVLIGGEFGTVDGTGRNSIARLHGDGSLDAGFDAGAGASNQVQAIALQGEGKVILGGFFLTVDGTARNRIARLNANGSLDTTFDPGTGASNSVQVVVVQPDGKVLIGGGFTSFDGTARSRIARLNAGGSLDTGFNPGTGADSTVQAIALQPDGKVLSGGYFTTINGTGRNHIARLNTNGSLDTAFDPGTGTDQVVLAAAVQSDGKVIIGGNFTEFDGTARNRIARLNADGSLDTTFDTSTGPNFAVRAMAVQPDGKVLVAGSFTMVGTVPRNRIARLNADGSLDSTFDPGTGASSWVDAVALQSDGKVLIGGDFVTVNGVARNYVARLNADGTVDTTFDTSTGAGDRVFDLAIQPDGQVLIGGDFETVDGEAHLRAARLNGANAPSITSGTPPSPATTGVAYSHTFAANGYPFAPRFYVTAGRLPDGLALNAATGELAGVPAAGGDFTFTVSACNFVAPCDSQAIQLTVERTVTFTYLPLVQK